MLVAPLSRSGPALLCALACAILLAHAPAHAQSSDAPAAAGDRLRARLLERTLQNPAPLPHGVQKLADLPYGSDKRQRMDVYLPPADARPSGLRTPVIFMVHGGAWRTGDKGSPKVVENKVARWVARGFVFVSINYRLLPEAPVAQQAHDVAQALATAQQRAAEWGADAGRFILMGHSAGAHLVSLLNAQPAFAQRQGAWPWLGAVSLDSAVLNLPRLMAAPHARLYDDAFGNNPAAWPLLSPYHQLVVGAPPYQLVCATERPDQPCQQAEAMARQAASLGVRAEMLPQPLDHGEINGELGLDSAYTRAVEGFMGSLDPLVARMLGR